MAHFESLKLYKLMEVVDFVDEFEDDMREDAKTDIDEEKAVTAKEKKSARPIKLLQDK